MAHIRNTRLRNLYEEAEFDREHGEVKEIEETVRNLVQEIAENIAEKDPLFRTTVLQEWQLLRRPQSRRAKRV